MAVTLKLVNAKDSDLRQVQQNVADAVTSLSTQLTPSIGVLKISSNTKLVGNEDVVLVDAGTAVASIQVVLPSKLNRELTVKVTRAGNFPVLVKAVDVAVKGSPTLDGAAQVVLDGTTSVRVVTDGLNYFTV